ncbi:MAG: AMP-binding protein [Deltaproteobacteria bacterium]|nr:AMP-binding protein [Deltaproteobacteria bacterium]MBW1850281.1 AMP-binding protein [Deltaproteobacteria bacterium]
MSKEWFEDEYWFVKSDRSIARAFEEVAERFPDREALVFKDQKQTYGEFQQRTNRFARGLLKTGVKKGDHIAIWATNNMDWVCAQFAAFKLGVPLIPVNTRFKPSEVEYILKQSDCHTLVFEEKFLDMIDALGMLNGMIPELKDSKPGDLSSSKFPRLKNVIHMGRESQPGMLGFEDVLRMGDDASLDNKLKDASDAISPEDISYIMYTSGTTGFPKGAMLRQRNSLTLFYLLGGPDVFSVSEETRQLCVAPLFTNFGSGSVIIPFLAGGCVVLLETFNPEEALKAIERGKITHLAAVPTMVLMMLEHPGLKNYDISSLKVVVLGGAPVSGKLTSGLKENTEVAVIINAYGLVEASGVSTATPPGASVEVVGSTVGKPLPFCNVKIVDPDTCKDMPTGEDGEIWVGDSTTPGRHVMAGYYKMPEETEQAIVDGWLRTGDMGRARQDGYYELTGRVKDMILVGGFNVYPAEIEDVVRSHPGVSDVSVIGIPDHRLGEVPMAYVRLKKGEVCSEEEIIAFCKEKMANTKVPRHVGFIDEFPMTAVGKVQKFVLKEKSVKELNLE